MDSILGEICAYSCKRKWQTFLFFVSFPFNDMHVCNMCMLSYLFSVQPIYTECRVWYENTLVVTHLVLCVLLYTWIDIV